MADHFNGLSPAEAERLAILIEECGEIVHAATKILQHGYENFNPFDPEPTNRENLAREIGDFDAICARMVAAGDVEPKRIKDASDRKATALQRWTHHQPDSQEADNGNG